MTPAYLTGRASALEALQIKEAAGFLRRAGTFLRSNLIGEPGAARSVARQLRSGAAFRRGGVYQRELNSPGKLLMQVGLPGAFGVVSTLSAPEGAKAETAGRAIGNTVGGFLGMPFGFVGSAAAGEAGGELGAMLGKPFGGSPVQQRVASTPSDYTRQNWNTVPRDWTPNRASWLSGTP